MHWQNLGKYAEWGILHPWRVDNHTLWSGMEIDRERDAGHLLLCPICDKPLNYKKAVTSSFAIPDREISPVVKIQMHPACQNEFDANLYSVLADKEKNVS